MINQICFLMPVLLCYILINQQFTKNRNYFFSICQVMKSNTQKILPHYDFQTNSKQPQQIVFRDSKFIFYDSFESSSKPILQSRNSNIIKNSLNQNAKCNNVNSRPQTSSTTIFRPLRKQKTFNKNSLTSKDNCSKNNLKIQLKPQNLALKNLQIQKSRSQTQKSVLRTSCLSNRLKEEPIKTQRSKNKNKSQIPQPVTKNICTKMKNNNRFTTINKMNNTSSDIHQNYTNWKQQSHKQSSLNKSRKEKDKYDVGSNQNQIKQTSIQNITGKFETDVKIGDENNKQINNFDKIRYLFGNHHLLLKLNKDFLAQHASLNKFSNSPNKKITLKNIEKLNIIDLIDNSYQENKLQQQLRLNFNYKSPHKDNISRLTDKNSKFYQINQNYSGLLTNSLICQQGFERAPILAYLKSTQTKKLYNILISEKVERNTEEDRNVYVDSEFHYQNISQIKGQEIKFVYIKPNSSVNIFFKQKEHNIACKDGSKNQQQYDYKSNTPSHKKSHALNFKASQLLFVKFLRYLYLIDDEIITRIFEPAINNVYSVWLFVNGCFEPIFVDGYFALDEQLNHLYGDSGQYLWLPILIKCICKLHNSYDRNILSKITPQQIYKLLTGMDLVLLPNSQISQLFSPEFYNLISKYLFKGYLPLSFSNCGESISVLKEDDKTKNVIVSYNHFSKQIGTFTAEKRILENVILLPPFFNWFIYSFQIVEFSLNKLQLFCPRDIQIVFSLENSKKSEPARIYIYQSSGAKKSSKIKLKLKYQSEIKGSLKHKLKRGNYRIFIQKGQKKMHLLFADKQDSQCQAQNQEKQQKNEQMRNCYLSVLASHEIKVKKVQQLQKRGGWVEDSQNIYQNCSFHRQAAKQNVE